jgi:ABC-type glycerol-3-phosphate transport system substrate-binding protein
MKNISVFQIIVLAFFMAVAIGGVILFATYGAGGRTAIPQAVVWGTVPGQFVNEMIRNININQTIVNVEYVQKNPETFENDFVNALAEGKGPDAVLLTDDMLYAQRNKLQPIPFDIYNERLYRDTFIDGARQFISPEGILGVPLSIDPLIMYWNRNIFSGSGVATVPRKWSELPALAPKLIQKTDTSDIVRAMVPFGEYENVTNAKAILSTLFLQSRNPITARSVELNAVVSTLGGSNYNQATRAPESVVDFYTSFANPSAPTYTWNKSLPSSQDAFLAGGLAMYFGFASEYTRLQEKNPNLSFDVALVPQDSDTLSTNYGKITAFAITKQTKNFNGALGVISKLTEKESIKIWSDITLLPPVRRDLLAEVQPNAYTTVFNQAALQSQTWSDPNTKQSDLIFKEMIESITSGRKKITEALSEASMKLEVLLRK